MHSISLAWFFPFFKGLLLGCAAMVLHEAAHIIAAIALGVRVKKVGIKWNKGIFTVRNSGSPRQNMIIALAGPLMNFLLIVTIVWAPTFGMANFCYALANLLPIDGSDGSRVLNCWNQIRKGQAAL